MLLEEPILNSTPTSNTMDNTTETRSGMSMNKVVDKVENRVLDY